MSSTMSLTSGLLAVGAAIAPLASASAGAERKLTWKSSFGSFGSTTSGFGSHVLSPPPPKAPREPVDSPSVPVLGDDYNEGDEGNEGNEGNIYTGSKGTIHSGVVCSATAYTQATSKAVDAHVAAVAEAVAVGCNGAETMYDFMHVFAKPETGFAIAQVLVDAQTTCASAGNAWGCAGAAAAGQAWATATAEAHASAFAAAVRDFCHCDTGAVAEAAGSAHVFLELAADVNARAEVAACVENNQFATASAYADCIAFAYAKVFASATADALAAGNCLDAGAAVNIAASVDADFYDIEGCASGDFSHGNANGQVDFNAAASVDEFDQCGTKYAKCCASGSNDGCDRGLVCADTTTTCTPCGFHGAIPCADGCDRGTMVMWVDHKEICMRGRD